MIIPVVFSSTSGTSFPIVLNNDNVFVREQSHPARISQRGQQCYRSSPFRGLEKGSGPVLWMANNRVSSEPFYSTPYAFPSTYVGADLESREKYKDPSVSAYSSPYDWAQIQRPGSSASGIDDWSTWQMEYEVKASAQAQMDADLIKDTLIGRERSKLGMMSSSLYAPSPPTRNNIALSGGIFAAIATFLLFHGALVSFFSFIVATYLANLDPIENGNNRSIGKIISDKENILAPFARTFSRVAYETIERSKPKVRAVVRTALEEDDEETIELRSKLWELEQENKELKFMVKRRKARDDRFVSNVYFRG